MGCPRTCSAVAGDGCPGRGLEWRRRFGRRPEDRRGSIYVRRRPQSWWDLCLHKLREKLAADVRTNAVLGEGCLLGGWLQVDRCRVCGRQLESRRSLCVAGFWHELDESVAAQPELDPGRFLRGWGQPFCSGLVRDDLLLKRRRPHLERRRCPGAILAWPGVFGRWLDAYCCGLRQ